MNVLHLSTEKYGDVEIREDQLSTITETELRKTGCTLSREELARCFAWKRMAASVRRQNVPAPGALFRRK
jgi:hypothetical protein